MKIVRARRSAFLAAVALAAGSLVTGAGAATGNIDYDCQIDGGYSFTFTFDQDTSADPTGYVGKKYVYSAKTSLPADGVNVARFFGVTAFDGAIDATVLVNGVPVQVRAPIKRTPVPPSGGIVLTATGPLPAVVRAAPSVVYKPGAIKFSVNAYQADNSKLFGLDRGDCTMDEAGATKTMDTVTYVKSPTRTSPAVAHAKRAKKVTAVARLTATSGVVPTGKVTAALFKGRTKVRTATPALVGGKATASFTRIKAKGSYRVVFTYAGSAAHHGSSATKTFTIR